jgi:hypothetical protein
MPNFHEPGGDGRAHLAETGYADLHSFLPHIFCR